MIERPTNEPVLNYLPTSPEREELQQAIDSTLSADYQIHPIVAGKILANNTTTTPLVCPHSHKTKLGNYTKATAQDITNAISVAKSTWHTWSALSQKERSAIFLRAAELLSTSWRQRFNSATMIELSKTCYQAEIDAVAELVDFLRFNVYFAEKMLEESQPFSPDGVRNSVEFRPLEGFVTAITPFNFVSISGNLPLAPALFGNTTLWKPSRNAILTGSLIMDLLKEAGLPEGVISFLPSDGATFLETALSDRSFAGIHFTGSTKVFRSMWGKIGTAIVNGKLQSYPRIVGETGGKDFIFAHETANVPALVTAIIRGAFEFQGQKCSAASRAYIPSNIWPEVQDRLIAEMKQVTIGDVTNFSNFMGAVIDKRAFDRIKGVIEASKNSATLIAGGTCDDSEGYFIHPTIFRVDDPKHTLMIDEHFAPLIGIYVYDTDKVAETLKLCNQNDYALTGAIFSEDKDIISQLSKALRHAAGNFYINDKPTGAVVGQQPFGGGRGSGTNDKAGSAANLIRWISQRTVKETLSPDEGWRYPHMS